MGSQRAILQRTKKEKKISRQAQTLTMAARGSLSLPSLTPRQCVDDFSMKLSINVGPAQLAKLEGPRSVLEVKFTSVGLSFQEIASWVLEPTHQISDIPKLHQKIPIREQRPKSKTTF